MSDSASTDPKDHAVLKLELEHYLDPALSVAKERALAVCPPAQLCHYTSADGLLGICTTKKMWASLSTSLNDASEREYALELTKAVVAGPVPGVSRALRRAVLGVLTGHRQGYQPRGIRIEPLRVFVASFCESLDVGAQWLHYGRSGTGVAMRFDASQLAKDPFQLTSIEYSEPVQRALITSILQRVEAGVVTVSAAMGAGSMARAYADAAVMVTAGLDLLAPCLKSPCFASEAEWRLVTYQLVSNPSAGTHLDVAYHMSAGRIVPHGLRHFEHLPLAEIILGYSSAMQPDDDCFRMLAPGVRVTKSPIPVRP